MCYYTKIDREKCIACGLCQLYAPSLFEYDAEGLAFTKNDANKGNIPVQEEELDPFIKAYRNCPTGAILRQHKPFASRE